VVVGIEPVGGDVVEERAGLLRRPDRHRGPRGDAFSELVCFVLLQQIQLSRALAADRQPKQDHPAEANTGCPAGADRVQSVAIHTEAK
jgi:hypothetical protein